MLESCLLGPPLPSSRSEAQSEDDFRGQLNSDLQRAACDHSLFVISVTRGPLSPPSHSPFNSALLSSGVRRQRQFPKASRGPGCFPPKPAAVAVSALRPFEGLPRTEGKQQRSDFSGRLPKSQSIFHTKRSCPLPPPEDSAKIPSPDLTPDLPFRSLRYSGSTRTTPSDREKGGNRRGCQETRSPGPEQSPSSNISPHWLRL